MRKRLLKRVLGALLALFFLYFAVIFIYGWVSDWQPAEGPEAMTVGQKGDTAPIADSVLSFVTWNIGFGGLGAESDFFYDDEGMWYSGSSMTRCPRPLVEKNLKGVEAFLQNEGADFFLLQEVDEDSDRSHRIPECKMFESALPDFATTYAQNYCCDRVPIPLLEPWNAYGRVRSGIMTMSRYRPEEAIRHQLPGKYPMPDRIFQLDRCAALHRYATAGGKDLVVINLHNSAYDPGDRIKAVQLPYLRYLAVSEYEKGNYVILGGDWNQCPPYFKFDAFMPGKTQGYQQGNIPPDFFPEGWTFA
ncbi:MAG: endonuclease/exonuclease/phosphatase family protein, partial [Saprospiraceae bacterium]|nr:endonuclease/exonuclease/phosphatase family protein [Saprospiraceae bacterium]